MPPETLYIVPLKVFFLSKGKKYILTKRIWERSSV